MPPELVAAIKDQEYACVSVPTKTGTAYLAKVPGAEIERLRGRFPILVRHELYAHPAAPVIRTVITLYDQPARPLALESFINVADPQQQADFSALATQQEMQLHFYDEHLAHRLSKLVGIVDQESVTGILEQAERLRTAIPGARFDFDQAKAAVMRTTTL